jgi:hypothetical protein
MKVAFSYQHFKKKHNNLWSHVLYLYIKKKQYFLDVQVLGGDFMGEG